MKIPNPKAYLGEAVNVYNRRRGKRGELGGGVWEGGVIVAAHFILDTNKTGWWSYRVDLDRRSATRVKYGQERGNHLLRIYASDEIIRGSHN